VHNFVRAKTHAHRHIRKLKHIHNTSITILLSLSTVDVADGVTAAEFTVALTGSDSADGVTADELTIAPTKSHSADGVTADELTIALIGSHSADGVTAAELTIAPTGSHSADGVTANESIDLRSSAAQLRVRSELSSTGKKLWLLGDFNVIEG
jgi:hypothetical protein